MKLVMKISLMFPLLIGVLLSLPVSAITPDAQAEVVFIANSSVPTNSLSKTQLKDIFLGNQVKWPDNIQIKVVTLKKGDIHKEFSKNYMQKSTSQFKMYWKKMVFIGKGSAPKKFESENDLVSFVADTEGAIGYISPGTQPEGIKVLSISGE